MTTKTVLIVDDEAAIREMIAVALEMADYRVLEADNAQAAHAMVVDDQPDPIAVQSTKSRWVSGSSPPIQRSIFLSTRC